MLFRSRSSSPTGLIKPWVDYSRETCCCLHHNLPLGVHQLVAITGLPPLRLATSSPTLPLPRRTDLPPRPQPRSYFDAQICHLTTNLAATLPSRSVTSPACSPSSSPVYHLPTNHAICIDLPHCLQPRRNYAVKICYLAAPLFVKACHLAVQPAGLPRHHQPH